MPPTDVPALLAPSDVAALVGLRPRQLTWWIYALDPQRRYDVFSIARRTAGHSRRISAPIAPLKEIQRRLADSLNAAVKAPGYVHGFAIGRSPVTNASEHQRRRWVFKCDLEDFFPSINFGRVRGMFMAYPFGYGEDVATVLAQICCHNNELPQGAPSSPAISNLICRGMDASLFRLAIANRCSFTRYADDLCFSTNLPIFPPKLATYDGNSPATVAPDMAQIITANGFRVNVQKTRLMHRTQRQRVTGIVVNAKPNVPRSYVRGIRNLLHIWEKYGEPDAQAALLRDEKHRNWPHGKSPPDFALVMRGRVQYVGSVKGWDSAVYRRLATRLQRLDTEFRPQTLRRLVSHQRVTIYAEGKTDYAHLRAALRYFHRQGQFLKLALHEPSDANYGGDAELKKSLTEARLRSHLEPVVYVFDRDNESIVRDVLGGHEFRNLGGNLAVMAICPPEWRSSKVCVELLYADDDLKRCDSSGRRVYRSEEFDDRGFHETESVFSPIVDRRALIRESVYRQIGDTSASIGLSKAKFAEHVFDESGEFAGVEFDGFRKTFDLLEETVVHLVSGP
jgi:RNA-directed DNA polymerase